VILEGSEREISREEGNANCYGNDTKEANSKKRR